MAKGSEDYWLNQSNFLPALIAQIKDALIENSSLINKLDSVDTKLDGLITLTSLSDQQIEILAAVLGIAAGTFDDTDLLGKLDVLDGTMDGKLSLTDLNSQQCSMLSKLAGIDTSLLTGSDLLNALDALDGTIDGKIDILNTDLKAKLDILDGTIDGKLTLAQLNSVDCDMLAKLAGIDTSLLTGSDLLNALDALDGTIDGKIDILNTDLKAKLDALDGTMDGKLDLTQLNASSVKTNLDTAITHLESLITQIQDGTNVQLENVVTQLTTAVIHLSATVDELVGVHSDTTAMIAYGSETTIGTINYSNWYLISSINQKRNMLKVTISNTPIKYSRDAGATTEGYIPAAGSVTVHDAPGFWCKADSPYSGSFSALEEWAT